MDQQPIVILGGGLAGISAALHCQSPFLLLEKNSELGGLARTETRDGFYFDHTGHWLHLRDEGMKALTERLLGGEMVKVQRKARIFSEGVLTRYPYQVNLLGLPAKVVHECVMGFVNAYTYRRENPNEQPSNFEAFCRYRLGDGISDRFMIPYNHKLWGVHPSELTSAWCGRFVPLPELEQVIAGAVGAGPAELGYNIEFMYPRQGGIQTFSRALAREIPTEKCELSCRVEAINLSQRTIKYNGKTLKYRALISSLPLPKLVPLLEDVSATIVEASSRLKATPVRYLNVATKRACPEDYHWIYVPEPEYPFYRVGVFSNAVSSMAPKDCSSYYVELANNRTFSDRAAATKDALQALVKVGAIRSVEDVLFADWREIDPAYVIFDKHYDRATATIHGYLQEQRVFSVGRYGAWIYNSMEDSLLAGRETVQICDKLPAA